MSVSIHSETSKDDIETEDAELEDLVRNLISRTGLLTQLQGQISKFIEDNGKTEKPLSIHAERAGRRILGCIFEYLQWIGMKQTNSVLLSESPVEVDMSVYESREDGSDYKPELCKLYEDHVMEGKGTSSRSHNYSRDEFEDSRLTSASRHQSMKSDNFVEDELNRNRNDSEEEEEQSYSSHKQSRRKSIPFGNGTEKNVNYVVPLTEDFKIANEVSINEKLESVVGVEDLNEDMISFNSPAERKSQFGTATGSKKSTATNSISG